jgi:hypothetical protein
MPCPTQMGMANGAETPALALEVGQNPAPLALLDGRYLEPGQFVPPQGAADRQRQDDVVALALQGRAVGDGQQLCGLLAGQPVAQASPPLTEVGDIGQAGRLLRSSLASTPSLRFRKARP